MDRISIIVPIYNMQDYLERCLDSILNQTYQCFEVICIDDGSVDMSGMICEQYGQKDERIKVYHVENGGVSNARNYGLSLVTGEWFAFIDPDDWVEPNYLEVLYTNAITENCSVSACSFRRDSDYVFCKQEGYGRILNFHSPKECIHSYICKNNSLQGMVWNKLYRTELYQNICFNTEYSINEDCLYTQSIMEKTESACLTDLKLYHWFYRENSASQTKRLKPDFSSADVFYILYLANKELLDNETIQVLKKNYVQCVIKILLYSKYDKRENDVQQAIERCKRWYTDISKDMSIKEKIKYYIVSIRLIVS